MCGATLGPRERKEASIITRDKGEVKFTIWGQKCPKCDQLISNMEDADKAFKSFDEAYKNKRE